jgi:hypothetical protein
MLRSTSSFETPNQHDFIIRQRGVSIRVLPGRTALLYICETRSELVSHISLHQDHDRDRDLSQLECPLVTKTGLCRSGLDRMNINDACDPRSLVLNP